MKIEVHEDLTGFAPSWARFNAIDSDTYDGPGSPIGYGSTEAAAIADLMHLIDEEIY